MSDVVWIDVLPSMGKFSKNMVNDAMSAGKLAGVKTGGAFSDALGKNAQGASDPIVKELTEAQKSAGALVTKLSSEVGKARQAQRKSAADLLTAEQRLADATAKYGTDSKQAQAAALRLENARDSAASATKRFEQSEEGLRSAQRGLRTTTDQLTKAQKTSATQVGKAPGIWGKFRSSMGKARQGTQKMAKSVGGLALQVGAAVGGAKLMSEAFGASLVNEKATDRLTAALAATPEQAERYGKAAGTLYAGAWGDSMEDVSHAVDAVVSSIGGMRDASQGEIESLTAAALDLSGAMGVDVSETAMTAGMLMKTGLAKNGMEAMDLLTASMSQVPKQVRGEVLPVMQEYSKHFAALGLDGSEAMALIVAASGDGAIGMDKVGDSLKEFTIRATDMSKSSGEAYSILGLDMKQMTNDLLAGGDTANSAMTKIITGLEDIKDPGDQAAAAIALFGTPLEDLGTDKIPQFLAQINPAKAALLDSAGAAERMGTALNDNTATGLETVKRSFMTALSEGITPILGPLNSIITWATETPGVLQGVSLALGVMALAIGAVTIASSPWLAIILGIGAAIGGIVALIYNWGDVMEWLSGVFDYVGKFIGGVWEKVTKWFSDLWADIKGMAKGVLDWMGRNWPTILAILTGPIGLAVLAVVKNWDKIKGAFTAGKDWVVGTFNAVWGAAVEGVSNRFNAVKDRLGRIWGNVKDVFKAGRDWVEDKVLDPFKNAIGTVGDAFKKIPGVVDKSWDKIKGFAAKPVNFVIETVYGKGIKGVWDKIADKVGLDLKLPKVNPIKMATGGVLPGYTPGRDVHRFVSPTGGLLDLSGGEAIMRPEFTRAVGGEAGVHRLNALARSGQISASQFALGGVWDTVKKGAKGAWNWTSGKASDAWDWSKNTAESVANFISDPIKAIAELIGKPVRDSLAKIAPGMTGRVGAALPPKFLDSLGNWAKKAVSGMGQADGISSPAGTGNGMGYKAMMGIIKKQFPGIAITSTYRPGAVTAGYGNQSYHALGRAIDMSPRMDVFNWLSRVYPNSAELLYSPAGPRQILRGGRRGDTSGVTRSNHYNHVHWAMANGGVIPPMLYDNGGVLAPGTTTVVNKTGSPEAVLTKQQWAAVEALVARTGKAELGVGDVHVTISVKDLEGLRDIEDFIKMVRAKARRKVGV